MRATPRKLIIIGAGGLGRIVCDVLARDTALHGQYRLGGFLDTRAGLALPPGLEIPVLGNPLTWQPDPEDRYLPAVGNPHWRDRLVAPLAARGARFFSYTRAASIASRTHVGQGSFLTPGCVVSTDCNIGAFAYLDTGVIVGHDVEIGEHCMIGAMGFLAGGVRIGNGVAIHPRAVIAKGIHVGDGATIGIGSVVVKNVPPNATVFGNPARVIDINTP